MSEQRRLTTEEKALKINLTSDIYGSFAEIGAGQEVAANFLKRADHLVQSPIHTPLMT